MDYQQVVADQTFLQMQTQAGGVNQFFHFQGLSKASDRWVVSPNNDTIYSIAIVDARKGFTLHVPDVGERFLSIQVQDYNHTIPYYEYGGGLYELSGLDTDYVGVGVRIGTDGSEEDVQRILEDIQPKLSIESKSSIPFEPLHDVDGAKFLELHNALVTHRDEEGMTSNGVAQYRIEDVKDWEVWTTVIAAQWGLSPDDTAMYPAFAPHGTLGNICYTAKFPKVPAKAFTSLTVYDSDAYLMSDEHSVISTLRGMDLDEDGGFTVAFGAEDCKGLAPNYLYTPEDNWTGLLRAYKPDVEKMLGYEMPKLIEVK
ncbi:DUF1254 domain-containing protein [Vibrio vulnificus]|uniref:DUF1254 domain-containing protein n=1 Tax=Vibrio vulnificus TaxID=672 RepID=UPI001F399FD7|nr:DUF1254 domain-containing protein [Vibrio vulnificus]